MRSILFYNLPFYIIFLLYDKVFIYPTDFGVQVSGQQSSETQFRNGECYFQHHIFSSSCEVLKAEAKMREKCEIIGFLLFYVFFFPHLQGSYRTLKVVPTETCIEIPRIDEFASVQFFVGEGRLKFHSSCGLLCLRFLSSVASVFNIPLSTPLISVKDVSTAF